MRRTFLFSCAFLACTAEAALAQSDPGSPFLRPEQKETTSPTCDTAFPSKVPVRCWVGQQFLVLPEDKTFRQLGYMDFSVAGDFTAHATYDELAGKVVTVTDVQRSGENNWVVTFKADDGKQAYTANATALLGETSSDATVLKLALLRDMKAARERYLGKTYWIKQDWLPRLGESGSIISTDIVAYKAYRPVTISDVLAGYSENEPVRIVVKNDAGQEGYFDMAASPTNHRGGAVGDAALSEYLADTDPRLAHKWPARVWQAIEDGKVYVGMTAEQALMSWG